RVFDRADHVDEQTGLGGDVEGGVGRIASCRRRCVDGSGCGGVVDEGPDGDGGGDGYGCRDEDDLSPARYETHVDEARCGRRERESSLLRASMPCSRSRGTVALKGEMLAAREGFEPSVEDPKSSALPLGHRAKPPQH